MEETIRLIEEAIQKINQDLQTYINIHYSFRFEQFEYEGSSMITIRYSIQAISNKESFAKVDLISEWADIPIEVIILKEGSLQRAKEDLLQRFIISVFRILLVGINSPLIINIDDKVQKEIEAWQKTKKQISDKMKELKS